MSAGFFDALSISGQAATEKARRVAKWLRRSTPSRYVITGPVPERLLLAPQDLRTADPTAAMDIYSGSFYLAGRVVDCQGADPFTMRDVPQSWLEELHAFGWIRHLEAEGSARSKTNIQALINDWMKRFSRPSSNFAWRKNVAARRLIAWLCHSVPVVEAASPKFYQEWLKSIATHIRFLKYGANDAEPGIEELTVRIALAYAALCVSGQSRNLRRAAPLLDDCLKEQIFRDGGHVSRNPQALVELLALLLPLRESYKRLGTAPSQTLVSSIDRMMAAVKFYRLGDGNIARFNGASGGRTELLATILQYDDSFGTASQSADQSGYQRMAQGETVLVMDTGAPPERQLSVSAHAGTLAFELSSGHNLIMVNCGSPVVEDARLAEIARATAAHNTLTLNDTSSSRFYKGTSFSRLLGRRITSGVRKVTCERQVTRNESGEGLVVEASHDGYLSPFGTIHSRKLHMLNNGNRIEVTERLTGPGGKAIAKKAKADFAIRFHLHPSVSAGKTDNGASILMMCGSGLAWKLTCIDCPPEIEESVFFSSTTGPKRTKQIVLAGNAHSTPEIRWLLVRQTNLT